MLRMKVIALSFKVDDDVNSVIASFVGTTPSKIHPLSKIMKPLIKRITDLYEVQVIDGYVPSEEYYILDNDDDPDNDEFLNFARCALPWVKNQELWLHYYGSCNYCGARLTEEERELEEDLLLLCNVCLKERYGIGLSDSD